MKGHSSNSRYRLKTKTVHGVRTGHHDNPHVMKAAARADGGMCEGKPAPKNLGKMGRLRPKREDGGEVERKTPDDPTADAVTHGVLGAGHGVLGALARGSRGAGPVGRAVGKAIEYGNYGIAGAHGVGGARALKRRQSVMDAPEDGKKGGGKVKKADGGVMSDRDSVLREAEETDDAAGAAGLHTLGIAGLTGAARKMPGPAGHIIRGIGLGGTAIGGGTVGRNLERGDTLRRKARGMPLREEKDGGPVGRKDGGSVSEVGTKELKQHALEHKAMAEKNG